jgi:hypothetical protein
VFNLAADPIFWRLDTTSNFGLGPWLGGYQLNKNAEPAGDWGWVTGESWSYTRWAPDEPNNAYGTEEYLQFFGYGGLMTPQWNDSSDDPRTHVPGNMVVSYVIEWNIIPEPSTAALSALSLLCLCAHLRHGRKAANG